MSSFFQHSIRGGVLLSFAPKLFDAPFYEVTLPLFIAGAIIGSLADVLEYTNRALFSNEIKWMQKEETHSLNPKYLIWKIMLYTPSHYLHVAIEDIIMHKYPDTPLTRANELFGFFILLPLVIKYFFINQ